MEGNHFDIFDNSFLRLAQRQVVSLEALALDTGIVGRNEGRESIPTATLSLRRRCCIKIGGDMLATFSAPSVVAAACY